MVPAKVIVRRYIRKKYACPRGHAVRTAELPPSVIDKGKYEALVYAHLAVAKYGDHLPLTRLEGIYKRHGFPLAKSSMWEMLRRTSEIAAEPILRPEARRIVLGTKESLGSTGERVTSAMSRRFRGTSGPGLPPGVEGLLDALRHSIAGDESDRSRSLARAWLSRRGARSDSRSMYACLFGVLLERRLASRRPGKMAPQARKHVYKARKRSSCC
jgi:hypothetical protein